MFAADGEFPQKKIPPNAAAANKPKPKTKPSLERKPVPQEPEQLLEEHLFLSLVGPVQFETFGQSDQTGEQKYDPNLISYGLAFRWRHNYSFGSVGPALLIRGFRAYENSSRLHPEGSTEQSTETTKVSATDFGTGYILSPQVTKSASWFPYLGIFFEYSQASASRQLAASSFQEAEDTAIISRKIFSYIQTSSAWVITFPSLTFTIELNLTLPVRSWQLHMNTTAQEDNLANRLQHKQAPGIGLSIGTAQWL